MLHLYIVSDEPKYEVDITISRLTKRNFEMSEINEQS